MGWQDVSPRMPSHRAEEGGGRMIIVVAILGFMMGFLVCHLWEDKVREETNKEFLKAMKESADKEGAEE